MSPCERSGCEKFRELAHKSSVNTCIIVTTGGVLGWMCGGFVGFMVDRRTTHVKTHESNVQLRRLHSRAHSQLMLSLPYVPANSSTQLVEPSMMTCCDC
eukprot:3529444-Amphidinium_carterae.1